ncbi:MAG: bifunctional precorrin-2 dehydrogenase/sirohydrochlorin ferrochelatase [Nitrospinaceae bacterium]
MIIDLNLKGKQALVVGGGREAHRKVEALLTQDCELVVVAETVCEDISRRAREGKITLKKNRVQDGRFLMEYDRLILVMAVTDDFQLNRKIVESAKQLRCYAYSADDPGVSDFSHPAVINLEDTVQIAVSTGGKSPLMAKMIRQKAESIFKDLISKEDILQIHLQDRVRKKARDVLQSAKDRKRFLENIYYNENIRALLSRGELEEAEVLAMRLLDKHGLPD